MNLAHVLERTARAHPDQPALLLDGASTSYAELDAQVAAAAGWLRAEGIGPGDRVALSLPNVPAFVVVYYAILRVGAVVVPMNPMLVPREVEHLLSDSGARLAVGAAADTATGARSVGIPFVAATELGSRIAAAGAEPVATAVEVAPEDTAVIIYTSGTTGTPKGAELRHDRLFLNQKVANEDLLHMIPGDVLVACLPLFHVFGMTAGMNLTVAAGGTMALVPRFVPGRVLELVEQAHATVFMGVPTMYAALLMAADARASHGQEPVDTSSLRICVSGGAALPVEVLHAVEKRFGTTVLEGYGLSETSPIASFNPIAGIRKPGSIGLPIRGVEMAIADKDGTLLDDGEVGEILIRGDNLMSGYWRQPEATEHAMRGGWFHTGDIGTRDGDGYYRVVDREKDLIISGGLNVYPREVEEVFYSHPDVAEAAVVGFAHRTLGEQVGAYVALKDGAGVTVEELRDYVQERVAPYKRPHRVVLLDVLPKNGTGKILKRELPREV